MAQGSGLVRKMGTTDDGVVEYELSFASFKAFQAEFAPYLSREGMFLPFKNPERPSTVLRFCVRLPDDFVLVEGAGVVSWNRRPEDAPDRVPGMAVRFATLAPHSQELIDKVVDTYIKRGGKPFELEPGGEPVVAEEVDPDATLIGLPPPIPPKKRPVPPPAVQLKVRSATADEAPPADGAASPPPGQGATPAPQPQDVESGASSAEAPATAPRHEHGPAADDGVATPAQAEVDESKEVSDHEPGPLELTLDDTGSSMTPVVAGLPQSAPEDDTPPGAVQMEFELLEEEAAVVEPAAETEAGPEFVAAGFEVGDAGDAALSATPPLDGAVENAENGFEVVVDSDGAADSSSVDFSPTGDVEGAAEPPPEPVTPAPAPREDVPVEAQPAAPEADVLAPPPEFGAGPAEVVEVDHAPEATQFMVEIPPQEAPETPSEEDPGPPTPQAVGPAENEQPAAAEAAPAVPSAVDETLRSPAAEEVIRRLVERQKEIDQAIEAEEEAATGDAVGLPAGGEDDGGPGPEVTPEVGAGTDVGEGPAPAMAGSEFNVSMFDTETEPDTTPLAASAGMAPEVTIAPSDEAPNRVSSRAVWLLAVLVAVALVAAGYQWRDRLLDVVGLGGARTEASAAGDSSISEPRAEPTALAESTPDVDESDAVVVQPTEGVIAGDADGDDALPAPTTVPTSRPAPTATAVSRPQADIPPTRATVIEDISWSHLGDRTVVTIRGNGRFAEDLVAALPMADPPRILVRLRRIEEKYRQYEIAVDSPHVTLIRTGHHPELRPPALYVVLDVADASITVTEQDIVGDTLRLTLR